MKVLDNLLRLKSDIHLKPFLILAWFGNISKRQEKSPRIYFRDSDMIGPAAIVLRPNVWTK